jgi:SAM-dependent methyltransferase
MAQEATNPTGESAFYGPDLAAAHHEGFSQIARDAADHLLRELAERDLRTGRIVDLGCGSGLLVARVAAAGYQVTGIDIAPDMIALARRLVPHADLVVGSIHDADLPVGCVAITAIGEVVNYTAGHGGGAAALERLAERAHAALVPGGVFLLDVLGPASAGSAVHRFHRTDRWCVGAEITESADSAWLTRQITVFTRDDGDRWRRSDETHRIRLLSRAEVEAAVATAGFAVEVRPGYRTAASRPGWYVVQATKAPP